MLIKTVHLVEKLIVKSNRFLSQKREDKEYVAASKQLQQFEFLLNRAKALYDFGKLEGLKDLIKISIRPLQYKSLREPYLKKDYGREFDLKWNESFNIHTHDSRFAKGFYKLLNSELCNIEKTDLFPLVDLATTPVLSSPWRPDRMIDNLGVIGDGLEKGTFTQKNNHILIYNSPFDIVWLERGHHSIMAGIIRGQGKLKPDIVHDYTALINAIRYDGLYWRCIDSNMKLGKPKHQELGWIWEIGRLIIKLAERELALSIEDQADIALFESG